MVIDHIYLNFKNIQQENSEQIKTEQSLHIKSPKKIQSLINVDQQQKKL